MVSTTDPDATPMPFGERTRLGYQAHYVVDGGRARIILNALVAPFEVTENRPMLDLLFGTTFRHGLRPRRAVGDAKYGTLENVRGLEKAGIQALVPVTDFNRRTRFFGKDRFAYDPKKDAYTCPAGEVLGPQGGPTREGLIRYRAPAKACAACSLRPDCTDNKQGRAVHRHPEERYLEIARARHGSESYKKAMRKRKVWAEPPFAEAKRWHGMERFRLRGLERVNAEALLVAAGQNIKKLLVFGGHRPKKPAQVAALRPPSAMDLESRRFRRHRARASESDVSCSATLCAIILHIRSRVFRPGTGLSGRAARICEYLTRVGGVFRGRFGEQPLVSRPPERLFDLARFFDQELPAAVVEPEVSATLVVELPDLLLDHPPDELGDRHALLEGRLQPR